MLDTTQPIELTHQAVLMSKDGRHWKAGKYAPNTVPAELAQDIYGQNFEADEKAEFDAPPVLGEQPKTKEPELKLEPKIEDKPVAKVAPAPPTTPVPPSA